MIRSSAFVVVFVVVATAACSPPDKTLTQPVAVSDTNPVKYPLSMWDQQVEGQTILLVHVDAHGKVDSTRVEKTSGHAEFDSAASAGARSMQFVPGRRGAKYVPMWTRMPVRFSMDSTTNVGIPVAPDSMHE